MEMEEEVQMNHSTVFFSLVFVFVFVFYFIFLSALGLISCG